MTSNAPRPSSAIAGPLRLGAPVLALLLAAGCHKSADSRPAEAPTAAPATTTRFAWGLPSVVRVDATTEKDGHVMASRFVLALDVAPDSVHAIVRTRDFEVLALDGHDARAPVIRAALAPMLAATATTSELVIDAAGDVVDVTLPDLDQLVTLVLAAKGQTDPEIEAMLRANFASEAGRQALIQESVAQWNTWVGAWVDLDLAPGQERTIDDEIETYGVRVPRRTLTRHMGAAGPSGHVRLYRRYTTEIRGADAVKIMEAMTGKPAPSFSDETLARVASRRTDELEIITDPATLRPTLVVVQETRESGGQRKLVRRDRYSFDWSHDREDAAMAASLVCPAGEPAALTREQVADTVLDHHDVVQGCFQLGLRKHPDLHGEVALRFTIGPDGRVLRSEFAGRSVPDEVAECVRLNSLAWRFAPPRCGEVVATHTFALGPKRADPPTRR